MFSCNVDGILNDLPGVAFIDKESRRLESRANRRAQHAA